MYKFSLVAFLFSIIKYTYFIYSKNTHIVYMMFVYLYNTYIYTYILGFVTDNMTPMRRNLISLLFMILTIPSLLFISYIQVYINTNKFIYYGICMLLFGITINIPKTLLGIYDIYYIY
jgi:hypothetical protein